MDWFIYDNGLRHERVKIKNLPKQLRKCETNWLLRSYFDFFFFYLDIRNDHLQTILFQLVSLTVSTWRKEARNKRKQFPLDRKSLSTTRNEKFG